ncbi:MAG: hypothetical protein JSR32_10140 [Proteobacteria bacterium]|nr:hypothetical protein [Pseudomonadota bacterium]
MVTLYSPYENIKKDPGALKKELTLLPYQARQYAEVPLLSENACRLKFIRSEKKTAGYGELIALFLSDTGKSINND